MLSSAELRTNLEPVREKQALLAVLSRGFYWVSFLIDVLNRMLLYLPFHLGVAAVHD